MKATRVIAALIGVIVGGLVGCAAAHAAPYSGHRHVPIRHAVIAAPKSTRTAVLPHPGGSTTVHVITPPPKLIVPIPVTASAGPEPDGVPASEVGPLEYSATGAQIAASWTTNPAADNHCTNPGIDVSGSDVTLSTTGAAGNCSELADELASYTSGIFEVRVDLPGSAAVADWPAFWLTAGEANTASTWPGGGEQDFMEGLLQNGATYPDAHTNYGTAASPQVDLIGVEKSVVPGWNTLTGVWGPGYIAVYDNGVLQFSSSDPNIVGGQPADAEDVMLTLDSAAAGPAEQMTVAYADVWGFR